MNLIQYCLSNIHHDIPEEVLERAFMNKEWRERKLPVSIDHLIRTKVLEERVFVDCNLIGGINTTVSLMGLTPEYLDPYTLIYTIPKERTQGKTITNALSIVFGEGASHGYSGIQRTANPALLDAATGVMNSFSPIPMVSTANVSLIGENVVMVRNNLALPTNVHLRCVLEIDSQFSHIRPPTYHMFYELVLYAVKAFIYKTLVVRMDRSALLGGSDLGSIKEIVDEYKDANELYRTYLRETWASVSILNDPEAKLRHLKSITGGNW